MPRMLEALLRLQSIEDKLVEVRRRLRTKSAAVESQQMRVDELRGEYQALHDQHQDGQKRIASVELELNSREEQVNKLRLLLNTLRRLSSGEDPAVVLHYYEIHLLDHAGYRPHLFHCSRCQGQIQPQDQYFSPSMGGVLCPKCGPLVPGAGSISLPALKYLRHFQRSDYQQACRAKLAPETDEQLQHLMQRYLSYILERSLNSPRALRWISAPDGGLRTDGSGGDQENND